MATRNYKVDTRHLTGNYRFADYGGLTLEVQVITSDPATAWVRATPEQLERLVKQISGGEQEIVTVTNLRVSRSGPSYTAYQVRDVIPPDPLDEDDDPSEYSNWIAKGRWYFEKSEGSDIGRGQWISWSEHLNDGKFEQGKIERIWEAWRDRAADAELRDLSGIPAAPVIRAYLPYDRYANYSFERWRLAGDERPAVPGDLRIMMQANWKTPTEEIYWAEIRYPRGWITLVLGDLDHGLWKYDGIKQAMASAMATHAMLVDREAF